ncbi:alpha,alpha-trehalase [Trichuris suis]|nr:alpha,alpha-trehalase [Trichuris suis]
MLMENPIRLSHPFTPEELRRLETLDSCEFGSINLVHPDSRFERRLVVKALKFYEQKWLELYAPMRNQADCKLEEKDNRMLCEIALKLGHFNLLIHDFFKALSAYQFCFEFKQEPWKVTLLPNGEKIILFSLLQTGCDLCLWSCLGVLPFQRAQMVNRVFFFLFFHMRVAHALELFEKLLYTHQNFAKCSEVHVRAGLCAKALYNWTLALKATFTIGQCRFVAQHFFQSGSAIPHRPLLGAEGLLYTFTYTVFNITKKLQGELRKAHDEYRSLLSLGDSISPMLRASLHRQLGWLIFRDESCGDKETRIAGAINELQRSLQLDPSSGRSHYYLGRCFSSINRAHDAFISYRHSIDKNEASADTWCSIGVLYQQQRQPFDALQAYACAIELDASLSSAWVDLGLLYEQHAQFRDALECYRNSCKHKSSADASILERIEFFEAHWKSNPKLMDNSQMHASSLPGVENISSLPIPAQLMGRQRTAHKNRIAMYLRGSLIGISLEEPDDDKSAVCLTPQQLQLMHMLNQNVGNLNPQQMITLRQLQESYAVMLQQGKGNMRPSEELKENVARRGSASASDAIPSAEMANTSDISLHTSPLNELPQVTQEDLQAFLGITDSEDLSGCLTEHDSRQKAREAKADSVFSSTSLLLTEGNSTPNYEIPQVFSLSVPLNVPLSTSGEEVITICKQKALGRCKPVYDEYVPPPEPPALNPPLAKEKLLMPTPLIVVDSKKDASMPELQYFCYEHPIALIRGLTAALRMDLSLFSTVSLLEKAPDHQVEVHTQIEQLPEKNLNKKGEMSWQFESVRTFTSISSYGPYQAATFREALLDEYEKRKVIGRQSVKNAALTKRRRELQPLKEIKFGANFDLSDGNLWNDQLKVALIDCFRQKRVRSSFLRLLKELAKLPPFCRLYASCNLLSHLGHAIIGMNTVRVHLKVPGSRTSAHQEHNNFAGININIGPGECEWFAVPVEYWFALKTLCDRNNVDFFRASWWPCLEELWESSIPIYRFSQKAGDVVWIGEGTIYWVHATVMLADFHFNLVTPFGRLQGWCNNIAWNVGPLTSAQFSLAAERYEINKLYTFKSLVPMVHLSWQLARNVRFSDQSLHELIRKVLIRSLAHCQMVLDYACEKLGKELKHHVREPGELSHYCYLCEVEVFNILFVLPRDERYFVHCLNCACKIDATLKRFVLLNQYHMKDLISVYDNFTLVVIGVAFCGFLVKSMQSNVSTPLSFVGIKFCPECNNMLYPRENKEERVLMYSCRNCDHRQVADNRCIYVNKVHEKSEYDHMLVLDTDSVNIYCHGPILDAVQKSHLYPDSKHFVDMALKQDPVITLQDFLALGDAINDKEVLHKFVETHFDPPGTELEVCFPEDWRPAPRSFNAIKDYELRRWAQTLNRMWKELCRKVRKEVRDHQELFSLLYVPNPFIIPGGRFREFYYWDTFWIVKGLLASDMFSTVRGMIRNLGYMVENHGFVPNGGRIYYLYRSQPPLLIPMVYDYYLATGDIDFLDEMLPLLEKEYRFWLRKRGSTYSVNNKTFDVFQYKAEMKIPRPESYREDLELVENLTSLPEREKVWAQIVSGAETGWDFSSRWFSHSGPEAYSLRSIRTWSIIPVDLNAFMCLNTKLLANMYEMVGNLTKVLQYQARFHEAKLAMKKIHWNEEDGIWYDYDLENQRHVDVYYISNVLPLYANCYDDESAPSRVYQYLKAVGAFNSTRGIPTSFIQTDQQWDSANAWPPMVHMLIEGFRTSGDPDLTASAQHLATQWLHSTYRAYMHTNAMFEKYNVSDVNELPGGGGGGEYEVQTGFGWTNGVILDLLAKYGDCITAAGASASSSFSLLVFFPILLFCRFQIL